VAQVRVGFLPDAVDDAGKNCQGEDASHEAIIFGQEE